MNTEFALLFGVWAFSVHYAARLLLQFDFGAIPRSDAEAHRTAIPRQTCRCVASPVEPAGPLRAEHAAYARGTSKPIR